MLLKFESMSEEQCRKLTKEIYWEGCVYNARYFHPDAEDLTAAIKEQEEYHVDFLLNRFLPKEENTYYVLEENGQWVSALRLTRIDDFYYLEALETPEEQRRKGYGAKLIKEVIDLLKKQAPVIIRCNVKKDNAASLATHKKCGFVIENDPAINCLTGESRVDCVGLCYASK